MTPWLTLVIGGVVLVIGIFGQFFGMRRQPRTHPEDKQMGRMVLTIGSTVVGLWILFFAVSHLMHLGIAGRW